jgi:SAM-dependent methyltransferase
MRRVDPAVCPSCGRRGVEVFYETRAVPVHSVLLFSTREEALSYPKGDISLAYCPSCGLITNTAFDPSLHEYSSRYEETQGFSSTFSAFHRKLAEQLVAAYRLRDKTVVEIGCGKGEFLTMLCELGPNRGIGFDPAYIPERNTSPARDRMTFVTDFYSEKYGHMTGDFICCKMTLEHIPETAEFVRTVRRSLGERKDVTIFFQIPEVRRILAERAFWDIYYEHCSYFSKGSLARLFRVCGFDVLKLWTDYDDQYLMIEARPAEVPSKAPLPEEDDLVVLREEVNVFVRGVENFLQEWRQRLADFRRNGTRAVIWGGGSKGVAFLTKLGVGEEIAYAIDINPYKEGTFMAGTGHEIKLPAFLKEFRPHEVIVMNPIYCDEVQQELERLGVSAKIVPVTTQGDRKG